MRKGMPAPKVVDGVVSLWEQMAESEHVKDGGRAGGDRLHFRAPKGCGYTSPEGKLLTGTQVDTRIAYMREWGMVTMVIPGVYALHPRDLWQIPHLSTKGDSL